MVILCFMFNYMLRVNMSIAIVDMTANNNSNGPHFSWDEHQKNDILGWFFWGFVITSIPGGRLSEIYGTRVVLGTAMLLASLLTILTPLACHLHYYWVLAARIALGLALGVSWPSIPPMAIKWVAPEDTSKFMSHTLACTLGAALTLPVCGYLIAYLGWPSVFYVTGSVSLVWSMSWFYLVYDSPGQHPRITTEEREALETEIKCANHLGEKNKTPWRKILTSGPVWAIVVADVCLQFNTNIVLNELPSYMDQVLHFNIKQNGWLSTTYIMAVISSYLADRYRKGKKFSTIAIRKIFTSLSFCIPILLFVIQSVWGYHRSVSVTIFTLCQGFLALSTPGFMSNSMDISPVYSGTIFGIAYACGSSTGYISAKLVALVTNGKPNFEQWQYIFWFLIGVNLIGSIFYLVFASGNLQKWNPKPNEAMEHLRGNEVNSKKDLGENYNL
ncbi:sialin, partial [Asbolus verrucosus]